MSLTKFMYPISDSGIYFELELLDITKEITQSKVSLKIKYSLKNVASEKFQIPIKISQSVYLDGAAYVNNPEEMDNLIFGEKVIDLKNNNEMFGYGDDHYVIFDIDEKKEFLIIFPESEYDFKCIDIEYFMKPENSDYGLYLLRYDFASNQIISYLCIRTYDQDNNED